MWRMDSSCGKRDGDRISFATARLISSYTRCSSSSVYLISLVSCAFVLAIPERAVSRHRGQLCRDGVFAVRVAIRLQCHGAGAGVVLPELDEVAARIAAVRGGAALHALIEVAHASPHFHAGDASTLARTSGGYDRNVSTSGSRAKP